MQRHRKNIDFSKFSKLSKHSGLIFGLLAAFFWGTHSVIVRYLTSDLGGLQIAVARLFIAAAVLYAILRITGAPASIKFKDWNFRLTVFATVTNYACFHIGLEYTSASNAMVLENIAPFFVLAFLYFFAGSSVQKTDIIATCLVVGGVFLTVYHDFIGGTQSFFGDMLEIAAGFTWAIFIIGSSRAMHNSNSTAERINFLMGVFLISGVILTPFSIFDTTMPTMNDAIFLVLTGVFPTALAYYLWYESAAKLSTLAAALISALSVVFTFFNAAIFLGTTVTPIAVLGAGLIVVAIAMNTLAKRDG
ncbi:Uncharacterised protein [BD1-7 clade bacterium]|uniref:EamA domain-containing protein n=1 Tax=BD1-7 clade bacterium TaxID=2029982 RepID=A0A5S9NSN8_9GAMM|nr:Uncharacterised protein [BD1-7 clade bacterium]CAA0093665.1 Uncharacterised protein [BD1-7 clade bacterium]